MKRRKTFTSISDSDDEDDIPTSYCPHCKQYGFNYLMGKRIYGEKEPIPSDDENWLQRHNCGLLLAKVHAQRETKLKGFIETPYTIYDSGKVTVLATNSSVKRRKMIDKLKKNKIVYDRENNFEDKDPDVQRIIREGKKLISYQSQDKDK